MRPGMERAQAPPRPPLLAFCAAQLALPPVNLPSSFQGVGFPTKVNLELSHSTCFSPITTRHTSPRGRAGEERRSSQAHWDHWLPPPHTHTHPPPLALSSFPSPFRQHRKLC